MGRGGFSFLPAPWLSPSPPPERGSTESLPDLGTFFWKNSLPNQGWSYPSYLLGDLRLHLHAGGLLLRGTVVVLASGRLLMDCRLLAANGNYSSYG